MNYIRDLKGSISYDKLFDKLPTHVALSIMQKAEGLDLSDLIEKTTPVPYVEVDQFVNNCCREEAGVYADPDDLWYAYLEYCRKLGVKSRSERSFFTTLDEMYLSTLRGYRGIALKNI